MDGSDRGTRDATLRTLDQELDVVRGAIALVVAGRTSRVQVGSLRFAEQLIVPAREMALGTGVRVIPLWTTDEACTGLSIERSDDD